MIEFWKFLTSGLWPFFGITLFIVIVIIAIGFAVNMARFKV